MLSLPNEAAVELTVYGIEGRRVSALYNGLKPSGMHTIVWNADNYPSGLYFVKLTADSFSETKKLMLLK